MIRVLHYGLSSNLGGIETYLYKLYSNIDRSEYEFDFLINGFKKPYWHDEFTLMGSKFYHVTNRRKNPLKNIEDISNIFKNEKFDIIHFHLNSLSYTAPVHYALKYNCPVIVHSRNAGILKSKITRTFHKINSIRLPQDKITKLAVSDYAGEWMFKSQKDVTVINNGIEIEKYKYNINSRHKIRKELGLSEEKAIVHIGAMREQKNHMFLLEVFSKVIEKGINSKLILIGEGNLMQEVEKRIDQLNIKENVLLVGNRNDVSDILSASDIFLFPSFYEGFPNAVLEAQTSGLPCLITDKITDEVIVNENCVAMSLDSTANEWAQKLLTLEECEDRYKAAIDVEEKGLSVKNEISKIEKIYKKMLLNKTSSLNNT